MLRTLTYLFNIGLGPCLVACEVIGDDLGGNPFIARPREPGLKFGELDRLGQGLDPVRDLGQAGVLRLEVEEAVLGRGFGVQLVLPRWAVHGSVGCIETFVATVPPRSAAPERNAAAACSNHGHSLAQWATSMRAQALSARWSWAR